MEKEEEKQDEAMKEKREEGRFASEDIFRYFRFGIFIILMLLLLVAIFQFYFLALGTISALFEYKYRSLVQAGFVACVIAVVVYLLRAVIVKEK
uniref:DUF8060 domain-containing protein n=1 Tax=Candidatus Methanophagaceae archaeon ANME-1 ERB6 TaxID=2759912 RepID=A0A7G9Z0C2_9EURY|nr:hypothetical protein ONPGGGGH_00004 [Methanosarcinales archaeon ANME-1 ERB6]